MNIRRWLIKALGFDQEIAEAHRAYWEAAKNNRLNKKQWSLASDSSINAALRSDLAVLRARASYLAASNALVAGMVETHANDIVGSKGPQLQVQSADNGYNEALERIWGDWWEAPHAARILSGPEIIRQWIRSLWTCGEFLCQVVTRDDGGPISARINNISPRRLDSASLGLGASDRRSMGITVDAFGAPEIYHVNSADDSLDFAVAGKEIQVPADRMIHGFRQLETGQIRGIPWLAPVLQTAADLADYDTQVLDAARAAALYPLLMQTNSPDATYADVSGNIEVERMTLTALPPQWQMAQINPAQPSAQYKEFRNERLLELGRSVGMPLMTLKLDSSDHNYSSARFDAQGYQRSNAALQGWLDRIAMRRLVAEVKREAELKRLIPVRTDVSYVWNWPVQPHVDPTKEAQATTERITNLTTTLRDECAALGKDWQDVIAQRAREEEAIRAAGIAWPPGAKETNNDATNNQNE